MMIQSTCKFRTRDDAALINLARTTVGIQEGIEGLVMDIQHLLSQLELLQGFIKSTEHEMELILKQIPYSRNLLSIKGFGVVTVAGLIGEITDFSKFTTQSEIMKLAGKPL